MPVKLQIAVSKLKLNSNNKAKNNYLKNTKKLSTIFHPTLHPVTMILCLVLHIYLELDFHFFYKSLFVCFYFKCICILCTCCPFAYSHKQYSILGLTSKMSFKFSFVLEFRYSGICHQNLEHR